MYRFRITGIELIGRTNYYTIETLFIPDEIMLPLKDIKESLYKNEFSNAIPKGDRGKPVLIPDVLENMKYLRQVMEGKHNFTVYVRERPKNGQHYYYITVFNNWYLDITELVWRTVSRYYKLTKTKEIAIKSQGDPVIDLIYAVNGEAQKCMIKPFIKTCYRVRKRLGTGKGYETKLVNRCLEEAGLQDFYVHVLKTGKFGFYYKGKLMQQGEVPRDVLDWLSSVVAYNKTIDKAKVERAIAIFEKRKQN